MSELTRESILSDIERFRQRQRAAQEALERLPKGFVPFKDYQKRKRRRWEYEHEIIHV